MDARVKPKAVVVGVREVLEEKMRGFTLKMEAKVKQKLEHSRD